jgi:alkanesulfonate monooxygenase SsuD/methylene tetrahydromethanopterin reductase-like flavin-dependent oxidoreductase (luciferase family)
VSSPDTAIQAGQRGIGCLGVSIGTPQEYAQRVADYRRAVKSCEPAGAFVNDQVNGVSFMYVDETDEEARTWGTKLAYTFSHLAAHLVGISSVYPTPAYKTPGLLFSIRGGGDEKAPGGGGIIREGMAIGSPQTVIKNLKMWQEIGVDRMVLIINTGEVIPQERVLKSLRLFAEEVMPAFDRPGAMTLDISASELVEPAMP